jgi:hypothetical protein
VFSHKPGISRGKGLVLGGGSDAAICGEITQEGSNFFLTHLRRMTFVVKEDKPADPVNVGFLCANAVMFDAQMPADAIENFGFA